MQWRSSSGWTTNCSSWPEGTERLFGTSAIAETETTLSPGSSCFPIWPQHRRDALMPTRSRGRRGGGGVLMGITWALNFTKPVLETFEFHSSNWLQKYRRGCFRTCTWSRQGSAVLSISKNAPQVSQAHVTSVLCKSIYITHSQREPGTPVIARTFSPFYSCKIMSLKSQWTLTWRGRKWAQWRSV